MKILWRPLHSVECLAWLGFSRLLEAVQTSPWCCAYERAPPEHVLWSNSVVEESQETSSDRGLRTCSVPVTV